MSLDTLYSDVDIIFVSNNNVDTAAASADIINLSSPETNNGSGRLIGFYDIPNCLFCLVWPLTL